MLVTSLSWNSCNSLDYFSVVLPTNPVLTNICPKPFMNICPLDSHHLVHPVCHRHLIFVMT
jgi:hypothetical protein